MSDTNVLIIAFGAAFILVGVAMKMGWWKTWYWKTRGGMYGYIPLGILLILYSFRDEAAQVLGRWNLVYQGSFVVIVLLAVWWSLRPPRMLKPNWVLWVEEYPGKIVQAMRADAENDKDWEKHVASQGELRTWADLLAKKIPKNKS